MDQVTTLSLCSVCQNTLQSPRRLVCGHGFCFTCIRSYLEEFNGKSTYPCPKCKHCINADPEVDDTYIKSLPEDDVTQEFILAKEKNIECKFHLRADIDSYCKTCVVPLCVLCRQEGHTNCEIIRPGEQLKEVFEEIKDVLMKKLRQMVSEFTDTHGTLLPKGRQLLMEKEQTALGISDYFSDLRQKVTQYLLQQEQKVQEDLDHLVSLEKDLLAEDLKLCTTMLEDVEEKSKIYKKICDASDKICETSMFRICSGMNRHLIQMNSMKNKFLLDPPETRFIINTELEDAMTSSDLIKIEVLNTRQYDHRKDTTIVHNEERPIEEVTEENSSDVNDQDRTDNSNSSSSSVTSETESESDQENDEITETCHNTEQNNVFIEISNTEEPPPPYPGIFSEQSSRQTPQQQEEPRIYPTGDQTKPALSDVISGSSPRQFHHLRPIPSAPLPNLMDRTEGSSWSTESEDQARPPRSPQPVRYAISGRPRVSSERSPQPQRRHQHHHPNHHQSVDRTRSRDRPGTRLCLQMCWKASSTAIGDMKPPRIFGLAWIDHEYLLLADRWNHRLKVVHSSGNVVHVFSLGNFQPWDIANMPEKYSAITVPDAKMIYIMFFIKPDLMIKRKIATKKGYSVLTYNPDDRTFIGATLSQFFSPPGIDILDSDGRILTSCYPENTGRTFLSYPRGISMVDDRIMVTDFQKKSVIFVKMSGRGHIFQKYQGTETFPLREPNGLALNPRDRYVIVIDSRSNRLHVVSPSGRFLGMVETELDNDEPCKAAIFVHRDSKPMLAIAYSNGNVATYVVNNRS
ncbi:RING finger protein nhl-1-like [Saccostrea echinata]|uniref:RING finger protein nhl-1-like n=1 Tax=Saccostrea echinata TaxID=191078 RepID=UPI002A8132A4|nr:RING finger protein nhl-1-like [Saccostrea echinata]